MMLNTSAFPSKLRRQEETRTSARQPTDNRWSGSDGRMLDNLAQQSKEIKSHNCKVVKVCKQSSEAKPSQLTRARDRGAGEGNRGLFTFLTSSFPCVRVLHPLSQLGPHRHNYWKQNDVVKMSRRQPRDLCPSPWWSSKRPSEKSDFL